MNSSDIQKFKVLLSEKQRRTALVLLTLMVFGTALEMLGIGLVIPFILVLMNPEIYLENPITSRLLQFFGNPSHDVVILSAMAIMIAIYFFKSAFLTFLSWRRAGVAYDLHADLSQRLFVIYLAQPYTFHLRRNSAELIRNVSVEITALTGQVVIPAMLLVAEGLAFIGICGVLLYVEPIGSALACLIVGGFVALLYGLIRNKILGWGRYRQFHEGMKIQHLQQGLGSIKDVLLLGKELDFHDRFRKHAEESAKAGRYRTAFQPIPGYWLEFLGVVGLVVLVMAMILQGRSSSAIIPTVGLFGAAAFRLIPAVNRMLTAAQSIRYGAPVIETLYNELCLPEYNKSTIGTPNLNFTERLELDDVTFSYPDDESSVVNGVSLTIKKGETIGLIGGSGAGKSTLLDLILGLLKPQSGTICVDGKDIFSVLHSWQSLIGYVPQSIFLTDDTLIRNVAFGLRDDDIDKNLVLESLHAAQLDQFLLDLPSGLETVVGERGVRLSGGQQQRIGLARAFYRNPKILVFDEATSSLDAKTESEVMKSILAARSDKTLIISTHRTSGLDQCDHVYKIDNGKLSTVS